MQALAEVVRADKPPRALLGRAQCCILGCVPQRPRGTLCSQYSRSILIFLARLDFPHNLLYCQIRAQNNNLSGPAT